MKKAVMNKIVFLILVFGVFGIGLVSAGFFGDLSKVESFTGKAIYSAYTGEICNNGMDDDERAEGGGELEHSEVDCYDTECEKSEWCFESKVDNWNECEKDIECKSHICGDSSCYADYRGVCLPRIIYCPDHVAVLGDASSSSGGGDGGGSKLCETEEDCLIQRSNLRISTDKSSYSLEDDEVNVTIISNLSQTVDLLLLVNSNSYGIWYGDVVKEERYIVTLPISSFRSITELDLDKVTLRVCPEGIYCKETKNNTVVISFEKRVFKELQGSTCSDVMDYLKNPYDLKVVNDDYYEEFLWTVDYYGSYDNSPYQGSEAMSQVSFVNRDNGYSNIFVSAREYDEESYKKIKLILNRTLDSNLCDLREIKGEQVYICISPWQAEEYLRGEEYEPWSKDDNLVLWFNENRIFYSRIYNWENSWDCFDKESCDELKEERHIEDLENLMESFDNLIDNREVYLFSPFDLGPKSKSLLGEFLKRCSSEIEESEIFCNSWVCKAEPVICPPHGKQTVKCVQSCWEKEIDYSSDSLKENVRTEEIFCSPGICSGCYVPRWFGGSSIDNTCIPYGFRFAKQTGWTLGEALESDSSETGILYVTNGRDNNDYSLEVYPDNTALLTLYYSLSDSLSDSLNFTIKEGSVIDLKDFLNDDGFEEEFLTFELKIDDVFYDENDSSVSYIRGTFTIEYKYETQIPETFNAYCDFDGEIKQQKITLSNGDWAKCQNNYECESNTCISGECIPIIELVKQNSNFAARFICRLADLLFVQDYDECLVERTS